MIRRLALLVASAVLAVVAASAPAYADGEIGLSPDGSTWGTQLATRLFDPGFVWVPGDVEQRTFFVRNDGPTASVLTVDLVAGDPDALLSADAFLVEARVGDGPWVNIEAGVSRLHQQAALPLAQGVRTSVTLRGTFRPESTKQNGIIPLQATINLSHDGSVGGVATGNGNDSNDGGGAVGGVDEGVLPDTGSPVEMVFLWLAAGLIGAGLALLPIRRRRREAVARG